MDILSLALSRLGIKVPQPVPASPGASTDAPAAKPPEEISDPTDKPVGPLNFDMVSGSQPANLLAAQSPDAAPSMVSPCALPIARRWYNKPIKGVSGTPAPAFRPPLFGQNPIPPNFKRGEYDSDYD